MRKSSGIHLVLCKAVLTLAHNCYLFLYMKCLGVDLLCVYVWIFALQYTTTCLQVLFSLQHLGRITKTYIAVITLN